MEKSKTQDSGSFEWDYSYSPRWRLLRPLSTKSLKMWVCSSLSLDPTSPFPPEYQNSCSTEETKVVNSFPNRSQTYCSQNSLRLNQVPVVSEVTLRYACCKPRSRTELWRPCPVRWRSLAARPTSFCLILHCLRNIFPSFSRSVYGTSWEPLSEPRIQTPHYMHIT